MMMKMMNCFCGMVDRRKLISLIYSRDHCQRSSPSWISNTPWTGFEPAQNLISGLVKWGGAVVITTTPQRHNSHDSPPSLTTIWKNFYWLSLSLNSLNSMGKGWTRGFLSNILSFIFTFIQCKLIIRNIFLFTLLTLGKSGRASNQGIYSHGSNCR